jgi:hypothetical protein
MAGEQTPAAAVFHECIGKLKLEIEWFPARDSFCVRLPGDDRGVAMDAYFHVVILENLVFRIIILASAISSARVVILPIELVSV